MEKNYAGMYVEVDEQDTNGNWVFSRMVHRTFLAREWDRMDSDDFYYWFSGGFTNIYVGF